MSLRSAIAGDAATVFLKANDFAETVLYVPHQFVGTAYRANRSILAIVERETVDVLSQDGEHAIPQCTIYVANSSTSGISSAEIDVGLDAVELPEREGEIAVRRTIVRMQEHDNGMLILQCR